MFYLFIFYIIVCLIGVNLKNIKNYNENVLSIDSTTMVNGAFVLMIFFNHFNQYVTYTNKLDLLYLRFIDKIGQLMVVTFFFYSGYGIYESIKKKGKIYVDKFLKERFLKVYIPFFLAIIIYMIFNLIINRNYSLFNNLLAFTGYSSIGNSNWFMMVTFILYIVTYIIFKYTKLDDFTKIFIIIFVSLLYMFIMNRLYYYEYWYNTILCFGAGMFFSYNKNKILEYVKNKFHYVFLLLLSFLIFVVGYVDHGFFSFNICSIGFNLVIFLIIYKIKFGNKVLFWFGKNTFSIYILQRIPMELYKKNLVTNIVIHFILSFITTIIMSLMFNKFIKIIYNKLKIAK